MYTRGAEAWGIGQGGSEIGGLACHPRHADVDGVSTGRAYTFRMRVHLAYGDGSLPIDLPDGAGILDLPPATPLADPVAALRAAIAQPLDAPSLAGLLTPTDDLAVVLSADTPAALNVVYAAEALHAAGAAGLSPERVSLIMGAGLWTANVAAAAAALERELPGAGHILAHDGRDPDALIFQRRHPHERRGGLYLNASYQRASVRILTGAVLAHPAAGWSGGGDAVLPGVAAAFNTAQTLSTTTLLHPQARAGVVTGNPVFEAIRATAETCHADMLWTAALTPRGQATTFMAGSVGAAHDAAITAARAAALRPPARPYDIVVAGCGQLGGSTLRGAAGALASAAAAVRPGGTVLLAAPCADGVGDGYAALLAAATPLAAWERLAGGEVAHAGLGLALRHLEARLRAQIHLHSRLPGADAHAAHVEPSADLSATLRGLPAGSGTSASVLAMVDAAATLPPEPAAR